MSEKQPTKQEVAKERTLSDAELIKKGAEYKEGEKTERLDVSQEVIDQAKKEMEETIAGKTNEVEDQTKKGEEKVKTSGGAPEDVKDAQKAGEELKDKTKSSAEQAKEEAEEEKLKTPEELSKDLQAKRATYIDAERKLEEARKKKSEGLAVIEYNFQKAKFDYENSRASYAKDLYEKKISLLKQNGLFEDDPRYKQELCNFTGDLYRDVLANEYDRLAQAKSENLTPLKRTWFRNTLEKFNKMPRWQRVLITTGLVTAVAGSGVGLGAAMVFAGSRFVRGMAGGILAAKGAAIVKTIGGRRVEEWLSNQDNNLRTQFEVDLSGEMAANNFEMFRDNMNRLFTERNQVVQETNRRHRNITLLAGGTALLIGGATAWSLSGSGAASVLEQKGATSFGFPAVTDHDIDVKVGAPLDIKETIAAAKLNEIVVQKGDSLWGVIDKKLEDVYGSQFESLKPAQKMYIVDSIKDEIARNPEAYGLKNIDQLQVGQKIDLSGVITDHKISSALDAANHLTDEQIKNIHEASLGVKAEPKIIDGAPVEEYPIEEDGAIIEGAPVIQEEVGEILKIAPEDIEKVLAKISETDKNMLMSVAGKEGGMEKFLKMSASDFFWDDTFGSPPYYREQVGNILKKIAGGDNPILKTNTPIGEIIKSIKK